MADFPAPRGGSSSMTGDPIWCVRAYERLWRPDACDAAVDQLLAPAFVGHTPAEMDTGRDEFKQDLRMALGALSDLDARFEPVLANGSRVAAHATIAGTHSGEFFGVAPTGKRLSWREVHVFDARDGQIVEHWMDAALLAAYMQMIGQSEPDSVPLRTVPSGIAREYTAEEHLIPLTGYMNMVASHDASTVREWATNDYLQHGPIGPNLTRDDSEARNRDIVWKALPDISIQLTLLLADGELVAARGLGKGTHTGAMLFGVASAGKHVTFTETHIYRIRGTKVCEHGYKSTSWACEPSCSYERPARSRPPPAEQRTITSTRQNDKIGRRLKQAWNRSRVSGRHFRSDAGGAGREFRRGAQKAGGFANEVASCCGAVLRHSTLPLTCVVNPLRRRSSLSRR